MLLQIDKSQLGDTHLDPKENLAKLQEGNTKLDQKFMLAGQKELENKEMSLGTPMAYQDLIRLLKRLCPRLIIRDGISNAVALRVPARPGEDSMDGTVYVTGFYKQVMPEFSHITTDERGRPHRHTRGWRTVLIDLIKQKLITYESAVHMFGEPNGLRSGRWQQLLRENKN